MYNKNTPLLTINISLPGQAWPNIVIISYLLFPLSSFTVLFLHSRPIMDDLDAALNELGMLSSITKYKIDYLQAIETSAEIKRGRSVSMPETRREESENKEVKISYSGEKKPPQFC